MESRITVWRGDITRLDIEVIVNAANSTLLGGGGVDGAIHRAAGPRLLEACRRLGGCPPGEVRFTEAFDLPATFVFHTVGPVWTGGLAGEDEILARCYRACLGLTLRFHVPLNGIAFPAISTGAYGFPKERAARIAVREVRAGIEQRPWIERVVLVGYDEAACDRYREALAGE